MLYIQSFWLHSKVQFCSCIILGNYLRSLLHYNQHLSWLYGTRVLQAMFHFNSCTLLFNGYLLCSLYVLQFKLWNFQELITYLKYTCPAHIYATSISPPAAQQIISSIKVILGEDGSSRGANTFLPVHYSNFYGPVKYSA